MTLVMTFSGLIHALGCRSAKRIYRVVAPELALADVAEFLRVRRFVGCGTCLREYRSENAS